MSRDRGDVSLAVCIVGAACTAAPFIVKASANDAATGVALWAGAIVAVIAAGTGMWAIAKNIWRWGRKIEDTFDAVAALQERSERMEVRQLAHQEQIRDLADAIRPTAD